MKMTPRQRAKRPKRGGPLWFGRKSLDALKRETRRDRLGGRDESNQEKGQRHMMQRRGGDGEGR